MTRRPLLGHAQQAERQQLLGRVQQQLLDDVELPCPSSSEMGARIECVNGDAERVSENFGYRPLAHAAGESN